MATPTRTTFRAGQAAAEEMQAKAGVSGSLGFEASPAGGTFRSSLSVVGVIGFGLLLAGLWAVDRYL